MIVHPTVPHRQTEQLPTTELEEVGPVEESDGSEQHAATNMNRDVAMD